MNVIQNFLTHNACYKEAETINVLGLMIHSTGANNPTLKRYVQPDIAGIGKNLYNNDWNRETPDDDYKCCHGFIGQLNNGQVAAIQTLPWNYNGWHCGGRGNFKYIGVEICEDGLTNHDYFLETKNTAVKLFAMLCKKYSLNPLDGDTIIDHSRGAELGIASGHSDIMHWWKKHDYDLTKFRYEIDKEMRVNDMTRSETLELMQTEFPKILDRYMENREKMTVSKWAESYFKYFTEIGVLDGTMPRGYMTREQFAKAMTTFAKVYGIEVEDA